MLSTLGWIGNMMLALCTIPMAWQSFRQKHSNGIPNLYLAMWLIGEILTLSYVYQKQDIPLMANYAINLICVAVIIRYKFK